MAESLGLLIQLSYGLVVALGLWVAVLMARRWCDAPGRRLLGFALAWYFVLLYVAAWSGVDWWWVRNGLATRGGLALALLLVVLEVRSCRTS